MIKKVQVLNKQTTSHEKDNFQSHDRKESKLNSMLTANSSVYTLINDKMIKNPFRRNNIATIKKTLTQILLIGSVTLIRCCRCKVPIQIWLISYQWQTPCQFWGKRFLLKCQNTKIIS